MKLGPLRRPTALAATLLVASVAAGVTAAAVRPRTGGRAYARLDGDAVKTRGARTAPLARIIEYEWPQFREDERAEVAVRFRDPECSPAGREGARRATAPVELAAPELVVTLLADGFRGQTREKRIALRGCEQRVVWDVVPERAREHVLAFRFETIVGDAGVTPSQFDVPVRGALFLPSSTLYHGSAALSAISGLLGIGGMLGKLRDLVGKLRARLRRGDATSAAP